MRAKIRKAPSIMYPTLRQLISAAATAALLSVLCSPLRAEWSPPKKKFVHAGWTPSAKFARENIRAMEQMPFDGIVIELDPAFKRAFEHREKWDEPAMQPFIDDLLNTEWEKFTDNFMLLNVSSDMDWFNDDHWKTILHNIRLHAKAVKRAGFKGIVFDPEQYGTPLWSYSKALHRDTRSYAEYSEEARRRGARWMEALQAVKPDMIILSYYQFTAFQGFLDPGEGTGAGLEERLGKSHYALYLPFLNGMLDAAGPGIVFIDGNESAYYYVKQADFERAYVDIRQRYLLLVAEENRAKYLDQVQVGSSVYLDGVFGVREVRAKAVGSFLTPQYRRSLCEHNVYHALHTADEYVWCYNDTWVIDWWSGKLPYGALEAVLAARHKYANRLPLGFSSEPFVAAREMQKDYQEVTRKNIFPRTATIHRVTADLSAPTIDGRLDDPIWQQVRPLADFSPRGIDMKIELEARTTAQVTWDEENLYVALACYEPNIAGMSLKAGEDHDEEIWRAESVEIFIAPDDREDGYPFRHFMVNPKNVHWDAIWTGIRDTELAWNADWHSRVNVGEDRWTTEVALPWAVIGGTPALGEKRRGNLSRNRSAAPRETSSWSQMWKLFAEVQYFGTWVFDE